MTDDLESLRKKAKAATPGPWFVKRAADGSYLWHIGQNGKVPILAVRNELLATYIAAASPDVVLSLIERVERLEEARQGNNELHRLRSAGEKILENRIRELEAENERLRKYEDEDLGLHTALGQMREKVEQALAELGEPQPGYPAPVANAVEHLLQALSTTEEGKESPRGFPAGRREGNNMNETDRVAEGYTFVVSERHERQGIEGGYTCTHDGEPWPCSYLALLSEAKHLREIETAARATANEPSSEDDWEAVKASNLNHLRKALDSKKEEG